MQRSPVSHHAFSLVELSIVLVILGLLTGGILAGQSLIRAAELRSITTDVGKYTAAINTFRGKYTAIPGDIAIATRFWGTDADCGIVLSIQTGVVLDTNGTCNGNGNGRLMDDAGSYESTGGGNFESHFFWHHLSRAGLIEGAYDGAGNDDRDCILGRTTPLSKFSNAGFGIGPGMTLSVTTLGMTFGTESTSGGQCMEDAVLKPEEIWNIDIKMDDGKPYVGNIRELQPEIGCVAANEYNLAGTTISCAIMFLNIIR